MLLTKVLTYTLTITPVHSDTAAADSLCGDEGHRQQCGQRVAQFDARPGRSRAGFRFRRAQGHLDRGDRLFAAGARLRQRVELQVKRGDGGKEARKAYTGMGMHALRHKRGCEYTP